MSCVELRFCPSSSFTVSSGFFPGRLGGAPCKTDRPGCVLRMAGCQPFLRSLWLPDHWHSARYPHKKDLLEQFLYPPLSSDCASLSCCAGHCEGCAELQLGLCDSLPFYLANFAVEFRIPGPSYGALWSLAVEEQFYLVWPLLVRRLQLRTLAAVCVLGIVLSPVLRAISVSNSMRLGSPYITTWLICDNLFYGALLAIFLRTAAATERRVAQLTVLLGGLGAVLLGAGFSFQLLSRGTPSGAAFQPIPFLFIFSAMLLVSLRFGDHPTVYRALAPIRFFGYISYGFYLFHTLGFFAFDWVTEHLGVNLQPPTIGFVLFRFVMVGACLTLFCYLSRRYFEEYFLRFKERLASDSSRASRSTEEMEVPLEPTCG